MGIRPVHGTAPGEASRRWFFDFGQQWTSLFSRTCNWYDLTLIKIEGEYAPYTGRWELALGLLGFNLLVTYVYDTTFSESIADLRDEIVEGLKAKTGATEVLDPTGALDAIKEAP